MLDRLGDIVLSSHDWNSDKGEYDRVTIDQADPRTCINAELLDQARAGKLRYISVDGDVFTVRGSNRTVIYRIGEYEMLRDIYLLEWPR